MQVAKWGNSLAVRLPKKLVENLDLKAGDDIEIVDAEAHRLVVMRTELRASALKRMASRSWIAPEDYRFDRGEANSR